MIPIILISIPLCTDIIRCFIRSISFELKYESPVFVSMLNFIIKTDNYILPISVMSPINTLMKSSLRFLNFFWMFLPHCEQFNKLSYCLMWKCTAHIFCLCLQNCLCTVAICLKICVVLLWHYARCKTRCKYYRARAQKHVNISSLQNISFLAEEV